MSYFWSSLVSPTLDLICVTYCIISKFPVNDTKPLLEDYPFSYFLINSDMFSHSVGLGAEY